MRRLLWFSKKNDPGATHGHISNVGVYLPEIMFSHGQLYVALSRATTNIRILVVPAIETDVNKRKRKKKLSKGIFTKNIVYKEVQTL